ncbi:hypothetical protein K8Z61_08135 [Nocardioides sp. TRM66260-LWL]|uniref:hypothetical protein n=1 Tax=Nocardioides sp. TRM66260-LWL TaxID=2874478 RepID=UPI001CC3734B|nr:hypothetical protein [Nocardioides sp. TRM66260-LWL]MBZ5734464.1 hypothetical protein [Nocardioides sp. TRM66260-LWL]
MRTLRRPARLATGLAAVAALAVPAVLAGSAQAATRTVVTVTDAKSDVQNEKPMTTAQKRSIDLTSLKATQRGAGTRLDVSVRTVTGAASSKAFYSIGFTLDTPGSHTVQLVLPYKRVVVISGGKTRSCSGATATRSANVYSFSVPSSCLVGSTARDVRVAGISGYLSSAGEVRGVDFTSPTTDAVRLRR